MPFPAPLLPWIEQVCWKTTADGRVPNDGGFVYFYEAGSLSTLQDTYSDEDLTVANPNPMELDTDGQFQDPVHILPASYQVRITDSDGVDLYTIDAVADPGWIALSTAGNVQAEGTTSSSTPYVVQTTDNLVIVTGSTNPFVVQLPAATDRGTMLVVKNISTGVVRITPDGADTIDNLAAYYSLPAASSPLMPSAMLISDGVSAWYVIGGIGL